MTFARSESFFGMPSPTSAPAREEPTAAVVQQLIAREGESAVLRSLGSWVLVGDKGGAPDALRGRGFREDAGALGGVVDPSWRVIPVRKRAGGASTGTILIGRTENNDVCLGHSTVSKLHARVRLVGKELVIEDAHASNGTQLNGTSLPPEMDFRLVHGDVLGFGSLRFQLHETVRLCALLRRR